MLETRLDILFYCSIGLALSGAGLFLVYPSIGSIMAVSGIGGMLLGGVLFVVFSRADGQRLRGHDRRRSVVLDTLKSLGFRVQGRPGDRTRYTGRDQALSVEVEIARVRPRTTIRVTLCGQGTFSTLPAEAIDDRSGSEVHADRIELGGPDDGAPPTGGVMLRAVVEAARARRIAPREAPERLARLATAGDMTALDALAQRPGGEAALDETCRSLLSDPRPGLRARAAGHLSTDALLNIADDHARAAAARRGAIDGLVGRETDGLERRLDHWLGHPPLQAATLRLATSRGGAPPGGFGRLRRLLEAGAGRGDVELLRAVAEALGAADDPKHVEALLTLSEHDAPEVRRAAWAALAAIGPSTALPRLQARAEGDTDPALRAAITAIRSRAAGHHGGLSVAADDAAGRLSAVEAQNSVKSL